VTSALTPSPSPHPVTSSHPHILTPSRCSPSSPQTYYIGVYSVCDSEFELVANVQEPPTRIRLDLDERTQGNGYDTLHGLVNAAEARRRACVFGTASATTKPTPDDPTKLFRALPDHLKNALTPNLTKKDGAQGGSSSKLNLSTGASTRSVTFPNAPAPPKGDAGSHGHAAEKKDAKKADAPPPLPMSILTTPYLCDACFGVAMAPLRGSQIAAMPGAVAAAAAAAVPAAADTIGTSNMLVPPPPPAAAPMGPHPWLPAEREPSKQAEIAKQTVRAPTDLTPLVMSARHCAMKGDLDQQMRRIASGAPPHATHLSGLEPPACLHPTWTWLDLTRLWPWD
jgi:hypothetical protein